MRDGYGKPILVTGSHRSGSTWVGKMMAASPELGYIHEPFNLKHDLGFCGARFDYWFTYICPDNEALYYKYFDKTVHFRYNVPWSWDLLTDSEKRTQVMNDYKHFERQRKAGLRPLIKDPIAVFSTEWLATRFNMDVIALIRHPAAFAYSIKKAGWAHDFSHFTRQPLLMRDHLSPFAEELQQFVDNRPDIIDQAALLWKLIHYMIAGYQDNYPNWLFVRHEDLSLDPINGFKTIFSKLNLTFTDGVRETIEDYSSPKNEKPSTEVLGFSKRDSRANISTWKTGLSADEIQRIRDRVGEVAFRYYSDDEW